MGFTHGIIQRYKTRCIQAYKRLVVIIVHFLIRRFWKMLLGGRFWAKPSF